MLPVSISRPGFAFIASACLMSGLALGAEDEATEAPFVFSDIRVGYTSDRAPDVTEKISSGGITTTNKWDAGDSYGSRFELGYRHGASDGGSGTFWGLQLGIGHYVLGDMDTSGTVAETTYSTAMLDFSYGLQYGIIDSGSLRGHVELAPFVGLGSGWLSVAGDRKYLFAYEGGVKAGAYLSERNVILGVTVAAAFGMAKRSFETSASSESELEFRTHGMRLGVEAGYRF